MKLEKEVQYLNELLKRNLIFDFVFNFPFYTYEAGRVGIEIDEKLYAEFKRYVNLLERIYKISIKTE